MSALKKAIFAAGMTLALATAAYASDASELSMKPNQVYFVDMKGHAMVGEMKAPSAELMARAQEVPAGTAFFMHNGKLMMVFDRGMVDLMSH